MLFKPIGAKLLGADKVFVAPKSVAFVAPEETHVHLAQRSGTGFNLHENARRACARRATSDPGVVDEVRTAS